MDLAIHVGKCPKNTEEKIPSVFPQCNLHKPAKAHISPDFGTPFALEPRRPECG
jgi:hypothetical protein